MRKIADFSAGNPLTRALMCRVTALTQIGTILLMLTSSDPCRFALKKVSPDISSFISLVFFTKI